MTSSSSAIPNPRLSLIPYGAVAGQLPDGLCLGPGSLGCVRPWPPRAQPCDQSSCHRPLRPPSGPTTRFLLVWNLFPWLTTATACPLSQPWQSASLPMLPSFTTWRIWTGTDLVTSQPRHGRAAAAKPCFQRASKHVAPCALQPSCLPQLLTTLFPAPAQAQRLGWHCLPFLPHSRLQWCLNVLAFRPLPNGASKPHSALLLRGYGKLLFHDRRPLTTALVLALLTPPLSHCLETASSFSQRIGNARQP